MSTSRCTAAFLALSLAAACSSESGIVTPDQDGGPDSGDPDPNFAYPIEGYSAMWEECSLYEGRDDGLAECATLELPLFWDDPDDSRTIDIRAKRLLSHDAASAQLWLLAGGPGQSGTWSLPARMQELQELIPSVDVYTLDHRGTGHSSRLGCPDAESDSSPSGSSINSAEMPDCVDALVEEWGDGLAGISTSGSAIDVAAFIEATREDEKRVFVQGGSYGTYWAQRYVQIFPRQADGIIIAGIFPATGTVVWYDEMTNQVANEFMNLCGEDPFCSTKLGADPWSRLGELLDDMDLGHCAGGAISKDLVRVLFAYLMYWNTTNIVVPAATYRLERCDDPDRAAILNMYDYLFGDGGTWDLESYSIMLQHHIQFSEMWTHPEFQDVDLYEYFASIHDDGYVIKDSGLAKMMFRDYWPIYQDTQWDDGWGQSQVPMLMLQGRFDPATPLAEAHKTADNFDGEHQHFVVFPHAAHATLGSTPTSSGDDCAYRLLAAFIADPLAALDTSCLEEVDTTDFEGSRELARGVFGTDDLWEN